MTQCSSPSIRKARIPPLAFLVVVLCGAPQLLLSQGRTSSISGIVVDQSGAAIPGASVTLQNLGTGAIRRMTTSENGLYRAAFQEPGEYEVTVELQGFRSSTSPLVILELDHEAVVNHTLQISGVSGNLEVRSEAEVVDTSPSPPSIVMDGRRIVDLPLNGRDYVQLATLGAGTDEARAHARNINVGFGIQLSILGSRPVQNNFRLDGVSLTNQTGSTPGSILGGNLGVDAIREFSLLGSTYSAQYGRAAGGVVNAVTRSGSNELHGTLFYFHRNDKLDARNFFDPNSPPPFPAPSVWRLRRGAHRSQQNLLFCQL